MYVLCTRMSEERAGTGDVGGKDRKIAGYFREPQQYEYGEDVGIELSAGPLRS